MRQRGVKMHSCLIEVRVERDGERRMIAELWHEGGRRLRVGETATVEQYSNRTLVVTSKRWKQSTSTYSDVRDDDNRPFEKGDRLTVIDILPELFR